MKSSKRDYSGIVFNLIGIVVFLAILNGCKAKKITTEKYTKPLAASNIVLGNQENYNSIERVWFKKISGVYTLDGKETKFKANIRLVKDSLIIVSISSNVGIEGLRVIISPDSVLIQNRLKARYYKDRIENLPKGRLQLWSFSLIQDILLINSEGLFSVNFSNPKYKSNDEQNQLCYINEEAELDILKFSNQFIHRETCFDNGTGLVSRGALSYSEWNEDATIYYLQYQNLESVFLPGIIEMESKYRNSTTHLKIELDKIDLNIYFPTRVKISSKYKRVYSADEI